MSATYQNALGQTISVPNSWADTIRQQGKVAVMNNSELPTIPEMPTNNNQPLQPLSPTNPTQQPLQPKTPTVGDVIKGAGVDYLTPEEKAFQDQYGTNLKNSSNVVVDQEQVRRDTMARFQQEIDALNSSYARKRADEALAGQGRLGTNRAIQARRGLAGSSFGTAQTATTEKYNQDIQDAIEEERLAKVSSILSKVNTMSQEEFDKKSDAKRKGADEYLNYINTSGERKKANTAKMAQYLYSSGGYDSLGEAGLKQVQLKHLQRLKP
jgi:hypothetical protein